MGTKQKLKTKIMAKAGTEQLVHTGSGKSTFVTINFYTKTKQFVAVGMPDDLTEWYAAKLDREKPKTYHYTGEVKGDSYDSCVKLAKEIYNEFYSLAITEEMIIAYKIQVNSGTRQDIYHAPTQAIGIQYRVLYRIKIGDDYFLSTRNYQESKRDSVNQVGGPRMIKEEGHNEYYNWRKIPYSEETETFFKVVVNGLHTMIDKITQFFGTDASVLIENLNSGKLLN